MNKKYMSDLMELNLVEWRTTRDYLQDASKVFGKLQQGFLPDSPKGWQYGLEVTMRGISTQTIEINGKPTRALIDLVRHKLRLGDKHWNLRDNTPTQLYSEVQNWLVENGCDDFVVKPEFHPGLVVYDTVQADKYAAALWWLENQFSSLKASLKQGVTSPILLYPHHFDLSLVWFPHDNEEQLAIGFSTGDQVIDEPYIYISFYPPSDSLKKPNLPPEVYLQEEGFEAAILPYIALQKSNSPKKLFSQFSSEFFK